MRFHKFFLKTLKDKTVEYQIRKETMRCLVFMIDQIEGKNASLYKDVIEPMLNTFDECVTKNDFDAEEIIILCLQIF